MTHAEAVIPSLTHRHGGDITAVHAIAHRTHKGVADWFFIADVSWTDGGRSELAEVSPTLVCCEPGKNGGLFKQLADYLDTRGAWHEPKSKRDGRVYSWTPHEPDGRQTLRQGRS